MTTDDPAFKKLADDVNLIKEALLGDQFQGRKGIIARHDQMVEDVYGLDSHGLPIESKKNTVLTRLSEVEDNHKKVKWIITGIISLGLALKFGISALLDKLFSK